MEINKPSSDLPMMFGGAMFCGLNVLRMGTQEQKEKWLPKANFRARSSLSIGLSEPDAGSDLGAIQTSAVLEWRSLGYQRIEDLADQAQAFQAT